MKFMEDTDEVDTYGGYGLGARGHGIPLRRAFLVARKWKLPHGCGDPRGPDGRSLLVSFLQEFRLFGYFTGMC